MFCYGNYFYQGSIPRTPISDVQSQVIKGTTLPRENNNHSGKYAVPLVSSLTCLDSTASLHTITTYFFVTSYFVKLEISMQCSIPYSECSLLKCLDPTASLHSNNYIFSFLVASNFIKLEISMQ